MSLSKSKALIFAKETAYILTSFFPLVFSLSYCLGYKEIIGTLLACAAMIFTPADKAKKIMPFYISFMIIGYAHQIGANVLVACAVCGALLIASAFCFDKLKKTFSSPVISGVMLSGALTATVLFTTQYFGIGATGITVREMIASYLSLGFHPNWRGVLYGTIVMVIMITFPKKFKIFSKTVSASFIAITVTLVLSLCLNPSDMVTAINEVSFSSADFAKGFLTERFINFEINEIISSVLCGIALYFVCFYAACENKESTKSDFIKCGISNALFGGLISLPMPCGIKSSKYKLLPGIVAAALTFLICFFGKSLLFRIPVHSCAVVIIVGAWQNVKWSEIKKAFGGITSIICFTASIIACLLFGIVYGIIISAIISIIYSSVAKKT